MRNIGNVRYKLYPKLFDISPVTKISFQQVFSFSFHLLCIKNISILSIDRPTCQKWRLFRSQIRMQWEALVMGFNTLWQISFSVLDGFNINGLVIRKSQVQILLLGRLHVDGFHGYEFNSSTPTGLPSAS